MAETSGPTFDVNVAILNALVITCRHGVYIRFLRLFSHFNRQAEKSTKKAQSTAVGEVDIYMSDLRSFAKMTAHHPRTKDQLNSEGRHWANYVMEDYNRPCPWHDTTLAFAIRCGWELYVVEKLEEHGNGLPEKRGRPLLDYAVRPEPTYSPYVYGMNPNIVKCLLEHGAGPNMKFNGYSAWSNTLYYVARYGVDALLRRDNLAAHALQVVEVMKLLLAYGAAKNAYCTSKSEKIPAAQVLRSAISRLGNAFPQEVRDWLQEVLEIIEDDKNDRGRVEQAWASLSQRIKARVLKRTR